LFSEKIDIIIGSYALVEPKHHLDNFSKKFYVADKNTVGCDLELNHSVDQLG
jgi:hypothetical protein